jgi:hypothetical protein
MKTSGSTARHPNRGQRGAVAGFAFLVLSSLSATSARADVVTDWNEAAMATIAQTNASLFAATRVLALMHVAMFDAINAAEPRYTSYLVRPKVVEKTSPEVAGAAAAHAVLLQLFPARAAEFDAMYQRSLAQAAGAGRGAGEKLGKEVAYSLLAARSGDATAPVPFRPIAEPGVYVPTVMPIGLDVSRQKPWLIERADQFRPPPPPKLKSAIWAADYEEVRSLGGRASRRTDAQSEAARFWIVVWPQSWSPIVKQLAALPGRSALDNARLFALTSMVAADAFSAVFDAKYAYNFWRPITAIRNGDRDSNDATALEIGWTPLIETPLHPEYPCAHCIVAGAVGAVLEAEFGSGRIGTLTMTSPTLPGVMRRWERIVDIVEEISNARVWGGIHYRNSTRVAEDMGRAIGKFALVHALRPAH